MFDEIFIAVTVMYNGIERERNGIGFYIFLLPTR